MRAWRGSVMDATMPVSVTSFASREPFKDRAPAIADRSPELQKTRPPSPGPPCVQRLNRQACDLGDSWRVNCLVKPAGIAFQDIF